MGKGFDVEFSHLRIAGGTPVVSDMVSKCIGELGVGVLDFLVFLLRVKVS